MRTVGIYTHRTDLAASLPTGIILDSEKNPENQEEHLKHINRLWVQDWIMAVKLYDGNKNLLHQCTTKQNIFCMGIFSELPSDVLYSWRSGNSTLCSGKCARWTKSQSAVLSTSFIKASWCAWGLSICDMKQTLFMSLFIFVIFKWLWNKIL